MSLIVVALIGVILALISGIFMMRSKMRKIWAELWSIQSQMNATRRYIVEHSKRLTLLEVGDKFRLKAAMPSQNGEDVFLYNFFGDKRNGFYIEIGAYDGFSFSNTYFFEALGWGGILIEPVPNLYRQCLVRRPNSRVINAAVGNPGEQRLTRFSAVEGPQGVDTLSFMNVNPQHLARVQNEGGVIHNIEVPLYSLNELLIDYRGEIDFVSIDVEGAELDVLHGFDLERFQPRVLVIEDNSNGADRDVTRYLSSHGYVERFRCEHNVFYTRKDEHRGFLWQFNMEA